jgi:protein-S-isoprenylcysteine O-methyltransferase Ste14
MWWVFAQIPLLAATIAWPVVQVMLHAMMPWIGILEFPARVAGLALIALAVVLFRAAKRQLGTALVASPMPVPHATLLETGVYASIRHPIYAAILSGVIGWSWLWNSVADLMLAVLCVAFFLSKSRYEEGLLTRTFPGYEEYKRHVPRLIPRRRQ